MYDTIIIPLDGSVHCEQAVPVARDEALRHESAIVLLHVIPRPERLIPDSRVTCGGPRITAPDWPQASIGKLTRMGQTYLEDVRRRYMLSEGTTLRVVVGEPVRRILAEAGCWPSPLIVMTSGEGTEVGQPSLSETTRRVLMHVRVPVLAVHAPTQANAVSAASFTGNSVQPQMTVTSGPVVFVQGH